MKWRIENYNANGGIPSRNSKPIGAPIGVVKMKKRKHYDQGIIVSKFVGQYFEQSIWEIKKENV